MSEHVIGAVDDFSNGDMKEFSLEGKTILVVKTRDQFYAIDGKCSHYGAPLIKGAISGSKVICPWHHACFNVKNGCMEEPPAIDDLESYPVKEKDGGLIVNLQPLEKDKPAKYAVETEENYVIVGGGNSAFFAAKSLRENGYKGKITILSRESHLPYDRIKCSKGFPEGGLDARDIYLKEESFYEDYAIDIKLNHKVSGVNTNTKTVTSTSGIEIPYDKVLIATGGKVRKLTVPGSNLKNVQTIRSVENTKTIINAAADAKKVAVVGSSFIGMESAAALSKKGLEVHVIGPEELPFASKWGRRVGKAIKALHESNGVTFHGGTMVKEIRGKGKVDSIELENGEVLPVDLVIVGIGVDPATDFIEDLTVEKDDSISTDEFLAVDPDIYVSGDIATFPYKGKSTRIEHWRFAAQTGLVAGSNMAGVKDKMDRVPFFWTMQHGKNFRYTGHTQSFDNIVYHGNVEELNFLAFYIKNNEVEAVLGCGRDKELAAIGLLMLENSMPDASLLNGETIDWVGLAKDNVSFQSR